MLEYRAEQDRQRDAYTLRMVKTARLGRILPFDVRKELLPRGGEIMSTYEIGQMVRRARKAMRLTQVRAAKYLDVGVRFLHDIEHGKPNASLGMTLEVLFRLGFMVEVKPSRAP